MTETPTITMVRDFVTANDFEKKHTPYMTVTPQGDKHMVTVEVGHEVPHPNGTDHYITSIELFAGEASIVRFDLSPVVTWPTVSVLIALPAGTVIRAVEHCNLHGYWSYEKAL